MVNERLKEIYKQNYLVVMDAAFRVLKDYHLAQDVCQDVFMQFSSIQISKEETPENIRRYLLVVTRNRAVDYLRKQKNRREVEYQSECEGPDAESPLESIEKSHDQKQLMRRIFADLESHRRDWHEVLVRVVVLEHSPERVSRDLGISVALVKYKLRKAKGWIANKYGRRYNFLK